MPWPDPQNQLAFLNGVILLFGVSLYALLGGADFGGGIWDLLAGGPRADEQRKVIANAIGPIWEANHVWLIFVIVLGGYGVTYLLAARLLGIQEAHDLLARLRRTGAGHGT